MSCALVAAVPVLFWVASNPLAGVVGLAAALAVRPVLDRGAGLGPVDDIQMGLLGVTPVVIDVEGAGGAHAHPCFTQDQPDNVLRKGVLVLGEMGEDLFGPVEV